MECIFFICWTLVPTAGNVLWCTEDYFCNSPGHTPAHQSFFNQCSLGIYGSLANRGQWGDRVASETTDKPFTLVISLSWSWMQRAADRPTCPCSGSLQLFTRRGSHSSRNFTPYWQCDFCQLLLQRPLPSAHPFFRPLLPSLSLALPYFNLLRWFCPESCQKKRQDPDIKTRGRWFVREVWLRCGFVFKVLCFFSWGRKLLSVMVLKTDQMISCDLKEWK